MFPKILAFFFEKLLQFSRLAIHTSINLRQTHHTLYLITIIFTQQTMEVKLHLLEYFIN